MSLRKSIAKALSVLGLLGCGGTGQAIAQIVNAPVMSHESTKNTPSKPNQVNQREILPDGVGGIQNSFWDFGTSPKEYGQFLQSTGRQKWTKSKTKKIKNEI